MAFRNGTLGTLVLGTLAILMAPVTGAHHFQVNRETCLDATGVDCNYTATFSCFNIVVTGTNECEETWTTPTTLKKVGCGYQPEVGTTQAYGTITGQTFNSAGDKKVSWVCVAVEQGNAVVLTNPVVTEDLGRSPVTKLVGRWNGNAVQNGDPISKWEVYVRMA